MNKTDLGWNLVTWICEVLVLGCSLSGIEPLTCMQWYVRLGMTVLKMKYGRVADQSGLDVDL